MISAGPNISRGASTIRMDDYSINESKEKISRLKVIPASKGGAFKGMN